MSISHGGSSGAAAVCVIRRNLARVGVQVIAFIVLFVVPSAIGSLQSCRPSKPARDSRAALDPSERTGPDWDGAPGDSAG